MTDGQAPTLKYRWSEARDLIAAALVVFQKNVKPVTKGKTAKVPTKSGGEYSYDYADLADVIEQTREARGAAGLAVVQLVTGDHGTLTIVTTVLHSSGQWFEGELTWRASDGRPQELGSLITYLRRYCYSAPLGISTEADDDGAAAQNSGGANATRARSAPPKGGAATAAPRPAPGTPQTVASGREPGADDGPAPTGPAATGDQKNYVLQAFKRLGWPIPHQRSWLQKHVGVQGVGDLTAPMFEIVKPLLDNHQTEAA
jgi:hypothetical protein